MFWIEMTLREREREREDEFGDSKWIVPNLLCMRNTFLRACFAVEVQRPLFMPLKIATKPRFFGSLFLPLWQTLFSLGLTLLSG